MPSHVSALGIIIKDLVPLIKKSRASCPSGRFPPSFIHQVIIITGLNRLYDCRGDRGRLFYLKFPGKPFIVATQTVLPNILAIILANYSNLVHSPMHDVMAGGSLSKDQ